MPKLEELQIIVWRSASDLSEKAACWFGGKWSILIEVYQESIKACTGQKMPCSAMMVEDTSATVEDLKEQGYSAEVLAALECLTKRDGERPVTIWAYVQR